MMATKREGIACYDKAGMDEPLFVLRAQDVLAADIVRTWADWAEAGGTKPEVVAEARRVADQMDAWPFHKHPGTSVERHAAPPRPETGTSAPSKTIKVPYEDSDGKGEFTTVAPIEPAVGAQRHELSITIEGTEQVATVMELLRKAGFQAVKSMYSTPLAAAPLERAGAFDAVTWRKDMMYHGLTKDCPTPKPNGSCPGHVIAAGQSAALATLSGAELEKVLVEHTPIFQGIVPNDSRELICHCGEWTAASGKSWVSHILNALLSQQVSK